VFEYTWIDWVIFYVGAGGFGGDPGPKSEALSPPEGSKPAFGVSYRVSENQAALYRLSGDLNPLHLDPEPQNAEDLIVQSFMVSVLTGLPPGPS
jgi:acyl dehydratase